jgi:PilZ domain
MSVPKPLLRVGQQLLVQLVDPSALMASFPVRVSAVTEDTVILRLLKPRRAILARGREIRLSGGSVSGAWTLRATVTRPLLPGRDWFAVSVGELEELVQNRREQRLRVQMPIRIKTESDIGPTEFIARTEDLSLGGMCLESPHALATDILLEMTLCLDTGASLTLKGVVVWHTESKREKRRFLLGVRFLEIARLPRLALWRFLTNKKPRSERLQ